MRTANVERQTGLPRSTLRLYERKGLISPERSSQGYRIYADRELEQLRDIRIGQILGFTLAELATLMRNREEASPDENRDEMIVSDRLAACEAELRELTRIRDYLRRVHTWVVDGKSGPKPVFDLIDDQITAPISA